MGERSLWQELLAGQGDKDYGSCTADPGALLGMIKSEGIFKTGEISVGFLLQQQMDIKTSGKSNNMNHKTGKIIKLRN